MLLLMNFGGGLDADPSLMVKLGIKPYGYPMAIWYFYVIFDCIVAFF